MMIVNSINRDKVSNSLNDKAKCADFYILFFIHDCFACMYIIYNICVCKGQKKESHALELELQ